jgi:hypothetical protein
MDGSIGGLVLLVKEYYAAQIRVMAALGDKNAFPRRREGGPERLTFVPQQTPLCSGRRPPPET